MKLKEYIKIFVKKDHRDPIMLDFCEDLSYELKKGLLPDKAEDIIFHIEMRACPEARECLYKMIKSYKNYCKCEL